MSDEFDDFFGDTNVSTEQNETEEKNDNEKSSSGSEDESSSEESEYEEEVIEVEDDSEEEEGGKIGGALRGIFRKKKKKKKKEEDPRLSDIMHGPKSFYFRPPAHKEHGEEEEWTLGYIRRYVGQYVTAWHFHKQNGEFMMAASMASNAKGICVFSTVNNTFKLSDINAIPRKATSPVYLGCMSYKKLGRFFDLWDYRVSNPNDKEHTTTKIYDVMHLRYETNVLARVPNVMKVVLERHNEHDAVKAKWKTLADRYDDTLIAKELKEDKKKTEKSGENGKQSASEDTPAVKYGTLVTREEGELMTFQTKQPVWNEELQAWTLNFDGRVKMASKKNFLLEVEDKFHLVNEFGEDTEQLRFGKVRKNVYSLDFKYPFSPIAALGVCISTFAKKMVVT